MAELRYHPLTRDWVMIASHRQNRPQMPRDFCPFCPGSGRIPPHYEVMEYDNDFPALSQDPPTPDDVATALYRTAPAYGKCEVILYSPEHDRTLPELPLPHIRKLVDLWCARYEAISADPGIRYTFIFENRGEVVGVTMPHPHGQIYGYPFVPKKLEIEAESMRLHREETGRCLVCDMDAEEEKAGLRMVYQNEHFMIYLPFFCEYPYGIYISARRHVRSIVELTDAERDGLSDAVLTAAGTLDALFGVRFPYMMCMHNPPVNTPGGDPDWHFHIEFFPPMRSDVKQKFNASSETGAWAHCNPTAPEEKAVELRQACTSFRTAHGLPGGAWEA
jgi:UDPglucose--hexose-1-phosphate uridylyltransferase